MESVGYEQREQLMSEREEWIDWEIRNLVRIIFYTIFQRKSFKRWFNLSFQKAFQQDLGRDEGAGGERELMRWCVDLVEKTRVVEGIQRRELEWEWIGIFKISEIVMGSNKKCKRFCFQDMVDEWIRSKIAKGWLEGIEANLDIGLKDGDVWIHGADHVGRLELLRGIKQAPIDMIGKVALMTLLLKPMVIFSFNLISVTLSYPNGIVIVSLAPKSEQL
jgi:hypothetical protein